MFSNLAARGALIGLALVIATTMSLHAQVARDRVEAFLEVTGFDVALESIRLSADSAPQMLGLEAEAFGSEWQRLVGDVFDTELMHDMARDILQDALDRDSLEHAAEFYASDLGQRLVEAENRSHMIEEDGLKSESGGAILKALRGIDSPRVALLARLNEASGNEDAVVRSIHEVQVRFLMAAAAAGVIELNMDEQDMREAMRAGEPELRESLRQGALEGSAYTYQAFSDAEVEDYAIALEHPKMQKVYELMNAVQYEIMANRFEAVADRLRQMQPSQDL